MKADLHVHTVNSDGKKKLNEILKSTNVSYNYPHVLAITDHHYLTLKSVYKKGLCTVIPGMEISAIHSGVSCHLTVYSSHPKLTRKCEKMLSNIIKGYQMRSKRIYKKIVQEGYKLPPYNSIRKSLPGPVYTYDLAHVLGKIIKINNDRGVIEWSKKHCNLLFVPEKNFLPDANLVISEFQKSGFVVCYAHPGTRFNSKKQLNDFEKIIAKLKNINLDGLEVFSSHHNIKQTNFFMKLAKKYNLLITGGSDFHGVGRGSDNTILNLNSRYTNLFLRRISIK